MKEKLEQLLTNMRAEFDRAREALRYANDDYILIQSIVVGMREDIHTLEAIIKDIPSIASTEIAAGQQPLGLEVE